MPNCITDIKTIHRFLTLTEGNWRNSIYIECKTCKYAPHEGCSDYLCIPDENGALVLLPVCDAKVLFTKYIDPLVDQSQPVSGDIPGVVQAEQRGTG